MQITIDTNDDVGVLKACRNMLNELIGEERPFIPFNAVSTAVDASVAESEGEGHQGGAGTDEETETGDTGNVEVDEHGVAFNAEFCGKAAKPFYASGKRKGQWKKRQGVTEEAYDDWYDSAPKSGTAAADSGDEQVNTGAAFGAADTAEPAVQAPTDCGAFMGWVSAKQAAGLLTQDDLGQAYAHAGITVTDLFPPADPAVIAEHIGKLYAFLVVKAGA